jgi:hypothetical protein
MASFTSNYLVPGANPNAGGGGSVNSVIAGTGITISGTATDPIVNATAIIKRPSQSIFVSPNGNDTTGDGSAVNPYLTITKALLIRTNLGANFEIEIILYAGIYTEQITLTYPNTYITAFPNQYDSTGSTNKPVTIDGGITITTQVITSNTNVIAFSNLNLVGPFIVVGTSVNQAVNFQMHNCRTSASITLQNQVLNISMNATFSDCFIINTNAEDRCILAVGFDLEIIRCEIVHSNNTAQSIINLQSGISKPSTLNMQYSQVISLSASTAVFPLIWYQNTFASSGTDQYLYNTFKYTQVTNPFSSPTKICILYDNAASLTVSNVMYNNFLNPGGSNIIKKVAATSPVTISNLFINYGSINSYFVDPAITVSDQGHIVTF